MKLDDEFFRSNREKIIRKLDGGLIILAAYRPIQFSGDMAASFRQESNFWYLSGVDAPDWRLIIDGIRGKSWLVAPELNETRQIFDGSLDWDEAKKRSGVDDIISAKELSNKLHELARNHSLVYTLGDEKEYTDFAKNPSQSELWEQLKRTFDTVRDCRHELASVRAIKQPAEIAAIKRAVRLTTETFTSIKANLMSLRHEYEVEAEFTYVFARHHVKHAYDPIIAVGKNACTLHYIENSSVLRKRQMVLIDVGAYVDGYAADITRTYVTSGEPSMRAAEIHEGLQVAQKEIIALLRPNLAITEYMEGVDTIMKRTLMDLKLIKNMNDEESYRRCMPHAISHGLGIDVHDSLGAPKVFLPGMVMTVEPGIYIPELNLGIRIEDDILITEHGQENLSRSLPTTW